MNMQLIDSEINILSDDSDLIEKIILPHWDVEIQKNVKGEHILGMFPPDDPDYYPEIDFVIPSLRVNKVDYVDIKGEICLIRNEKVLYVSIYAGVREEYAGVKKPTSKQSLTKQAKKKIKQEIEDFYCDLIITNLKSICDHQTALAAEKLREKARQEIERLEKIIDFSKTWEKMVRLKLKDLKQKHE